MAKIRKTASIESGIMQVLKILNEDEIQAAIGKGSSYLRKCSDPDQPNQIDHNESFYNYNIYYSIQYISSC